MTDKKETASQHVIQHVERARGAIDNFRRDGTTSDGVLRNPQVQTTALKVAREELNKAIAILERAKWK